MSHTIAVPGSVRLALPVSILFCGLLTSVPIVRARAQEDVGAAVAQLKKLYFMHDYEGGVEQGKKWRERAPDSFEVRSWYVLNLSGLRHSDEAVLEGEAMVAAEPDNLWSWFGLAGGLNWHSQRGKEALGASEKALAMAPDNPDVLWLRAMVLLRQDTPQAVLGFIDSLPEAVQQSPSMLIRKAVGVEFAWNALSAEEKKTTPNECYAVFEEVRKLDSLNVIAHYLPGAYYLSNGEREKALPLLTRAATLTPGYDVHEWYWRAIRASKDDSLEQQVAKIEADIASLEARGANGPETLRAEASILGELKMPDKQHALEKRILNEYPESGAAEWLLVDRYRAVRKVLYDAEQAGEPRDSAKADEFRHMLVAFIERPQHQNKSLLGDAYRELFYLVKDDSTVDGDYLYSIVDGMVQHEGINAHIAYGMGPIALAEHQTHLEDAERIARAGIEEAKKRIERQRSVYKTDEEYQKAVDGYTATIYDALGWVYFLAGRLDDAGENLLHAHELSGASMENLHHLGRYYERRAGDAVAANDGDSVETFLDRAEELYKQGVTVPAFGGTNPNKEALKALYIRRHGDEEGYRAFMAKVEEADRERRRTQVLETRISEPDSLTTFSLTALDSSTVSYEDVRGKVLVINFWGVWCGPCVIEMPEFQKLYEQYKDDPDVAILTIDTNDDFGDLKAWMTKRGYTFPVLVDDGYVGKIGIHGFPTTWFVDRGGHIVFTKLGSTEKLAEEFGWRVEALKEKTEK